MKIDVLLIFKWCMDIQILMQQFCEYSISIRGYSKDTIRRYKFVIKYYCKFAQIEQISQVTDENVRALFYYGRTERKWSVNTFIVYRLWRSMNQIASIPQNSP